MRLTRAIVVGLTGVLMIAGGLVHPVAAADFPVRTITVVSPYAAGGMGDSLARVAAEGLQPLGQPVIVESRPGAGNLIATQYVARAKPDGHTVLITTQNFVILPALSPKQPFDPIKDFVPVAHLVDAPVLLAVGSQHGINSWADFVRYAKQNPGRLSYGHLGNGSVGHVYSQMINEQAGVNLLIVPYKGEAPAVTDILGGNLQSTWMTVGTFKNVAADKIRAVAVSGAVRIPQAPNVPTLTELGIPVTPNWWGLFTPAGTPPEIVSTLSTNTARHLQDAKVRARLDALGTVVSDSTRPAFVKMLQEDFEQWKRAAAKYRIALD